MVTEALRHIKAELAALLDAPTMLALCREVGYQWRARLLDPVTTVQLFILQILHGNTACRHLPHLAAQRFTASAFCQARTRLPLVVWQQLLRRTAAVGEQATHDEGRWHGHRTFLVDGSGVSMPDTPELQEDFGQPRGQRRGVGSPCPTCSPSCRPGQASCWRGSRRPGTPTPWPRWLRYMPH